jgi:hypothetical protein
MTQSTQTQPTPTQSTQVISAVAVRLGIGGGAVLGAFAGYWAGTRGGLAAEGMHAWPMVAGAIAGFVAAWVGLTWVARRHLGAGAAAGGAFTLAAAAALAAYFLL